jgi:pSer/pThr/pTyr-binding forkhead associated (FHA) protein
VARLQVKSGPLEGKTIEVTGDLVLGRADADADIAIDDAEISRRHCVVRQLSGAIEIEDLGSKNGTFVNGGRIDGPTRAGGGAEIRLGATVIEVEGVIPVEPTQVTTPADRDATIIGKVPEEMLESASPRPSTGALARPAPETPSPVGQFQPPARRRGRGLASRSWVPLALSFGSVILTAVALVIYFAAR